MGKWSIPKRIHKLILDGFKAPLFDSLRWCRINNTNSILMNRKSTAFNPGRNQLVNPLRYIIFLWLGSTWGFCADLPVLDPNSPAFAWMDEQVEEDFNSLYLQKISTEIYQKQQLLFPVECPECISQEQYIQSLKLNASTDWVVRFQIINNQVKGPPNFCKGMLEYLCRTYGLPDVDFLYWNQDGPITRFPGNAPVLTGIRRKGTANNLLFGNVWIFDINDPDRGLRRDLARIDAISPLIPWSARENKAFWRGAGSDLWSDGGFYSVSNWHKHARGAVCALSQKKPHLVDAAFTQFHIFFSEGGEEGVKKLEKVAPMAMPASIDEHLKYKYQPQVAGVIGNFPRDVWQLYSDSVSFRHPYLDDVYWSHLIEPWIHYIPVKATMSDLEEKIQWARAHDKESEQIAKRAKQFAQTHCMPEHMALYCYKVLLRYAQIQKFDPRDIPYPNPDRSILPE